MSPPNAPDVLVLGGGAAGVAAAVGASRAGARVTLIERYGFLGGLATTALVGTVCGLHLRREGPPAWAVSGFPRAFGERLAAASGTEPVGWRDGLWFLPYDAAAFRDLADALCVEHNVDLRLHTTLTGVARDGDRLGAVSVLAWDRPLTLAPRAVVDATGTATGALLAGAATLDDGDHQAPALVLALAGLPPLSTDALRLGLLRDVVRAVRAGRLPPDAETLSIVPGSHRGDRVHLKLGLRGRTRGVPDELTALERRARAEAREVVAFLRAEVEGLHGVVVTETAAQLGARTGRRGHGAAVLDEATVLGGAATDDGVAVGAWPIEVWGEDARPSLRCGPDGATYTIPAGALRSRDVDGLFLAGRAISATEAAIASARVIGTCLGTGYAAGWMAAAHALGRPGDAAVAAVREELGCNR